MKDEMGRRLFRGNRYSSFCLHTSEAALPENVNYTVKSW